MACPKSKPLDDLNAGDDITVITTPPMTFTTRGEFVAVEKHGRRYWLFLIPSGKTVPTGIKTDRLDPNRGGHIRLNRRATTRS